MQSVQLGPEICNISHVNNVSSNSSILPSGCDNTLRRTLLTTSANDSLAPASNKAVHRCIRK